MKIKFYTLIIVLLLFASCVVIDKRGKVPILGKTVEDAYLSEGNEYTNTSILKDVKGNLYVLSQIDDYKYIMIKWDNGFTSLGLIKNNKELGEWYLYDKKNRLIKSVYYLENGNSISTIDKYNKKGQLIYRNSYSPSF